MINNPCLINPCDESKKIEHELTEWLTALPCVAFIGNTLSNVYSFSRLYRPSRINSWGDANIGDHRHKSALSPFRRTLASTLLLPNSLHISHAPGLASQSPWYRLGPQTAVPCP